MARRRHLWKLWILSIDDCNHFEKFVKGNWNRCSFGYELSVRGESIPVGGWFRDCVFSGQLK